MEINKIKENFLDLNQDLVESFIKDKLINLRNDFKSEVSGPGCTPCKMNAAKRKYSVLIDQLINEYKRNEKLIS